MINAGAYNKKITIYKIKKEKNSNGFLVDSDFTETVLSCYAKVKTTRGMTLIANNSDFEKAYTNFTIRYPSVKITRDMLISFNNKVYSIEYLNNINEDNIELEIQAKEVTK